MASYKLYITLLFLCLILKLISGDNIEHRLINRFNDVRSMCINSRHQKRPAYECTGLMIRGVSNIGFGAEQKHAWSKKQINKRTNAFSVGFLRKDQLFHSFPGGYDSGFILYPHLRTPRGKARFDVLCAFPVNAHTNDRSGRHACGRSNDDRTGNSKHCHAQRITSIKAWISHYEKIVHSKNKNFIKKQCGFDTTTKDSAEIFNVALEANKYLRKYSKYGWRNNELRIRAWNENNPKEIPIEAFFYLIESKGGREKAMMYQINYFVQTNERVPIVGIRLPSPKYPHLIVKSYTPSYYAHMDKNTKFTIIKHEENI